MLCDRKMLLLIKTTFYLSSLPTTLKETALYPYKESPLNDLKYEQQWLIVPPDSTSVDNMTMIKVISGDDLLQDGLEAFGRPIEVTEDEEQEVQLIQSSMINMFESHEDYVSETYNPCAYITGKIETWVQNIYLNNSSTFNSTIVYCD
jgi:hypothetical protein